MRGGRAGPADTFLSSRLPSARYLIRAGVASDHPTVPPPPGGRLKVLYVTAKNQHVFFCGGCLFRRGLQKGGRVAHGTGITGDKKTIARFVFWRNENTLYTRLPRPLVGVPLSWLCHTGMAPLQLVGLSRLAVHRNVDPRRNACKVICQYSSTRHHCRTRNSGTSASKFPNNKNSASSEMSG